MPSVYIDRHILRDYNNQSIPPIIPYDDIPFFMLRDPVYADHSLLQDLKKYVTPTGLQSHDPSVRKVVFDSLKSHPELLLHYLRS